MQVLTLSSSLSGDVLTLTGVVQFDEPLPELEDSYPGEMITEMILYQTPLKRELYEVRKATVSPEHLTQLTIWSFQIELEHKSNAQTTRR